MRAPDFLECRFWTDPPAPPADPAIRDNEHHLTELISQPARATPATPKRRMESGYLLSGRYRIEDLIGRGSQSTVFRAHDELLQREVAVKLFRNDADDLEQTR